jgi:hypothetical protein
MTTSSTSRNDEAKQAEWVCFKGESDGARFEVVTDMQTGATGIRIEVGGNVHVRTFREWHRLAQESLLSENATINGGRGQGLPESREAGQGLGMPSSQAENEATRAGYRAPLPSSSDKNEKAWPIPSLEELRVQVDDFATGRAAMQAYINGLEHELRARLTPSAGRVSDRCQNCPWPKDGCIFPKCGQESIPSHGGNSDEVIQAFEEGLRYGRRGFMSLKELIEEYEAEPGRREELNKAREWLKKHLHATERTSSSDSGNARSSDISHEVERD